MYSYVIMEIFGTHISFSVRVKTFSGRRRTGTQFCQECPVNIKSDLSISAGGYMTDINHSLENLNLHVFEDIVKDGCSDNTIVNYSSETGGTQGKKYYRMSPLILFRSGETQRANNQTRTGLLVALLVALANSVSLQDKLTVDAGTNQVKFAPDFMEQLRESLI